MNIFGAYLNQTGHWTAFNESTGRDLSTHGTFESAMSACRKYTDCEFRRYRSAPAMSNLSRKAI